MPRGTRVTDGITGANLRFEASLRVPADKRRTNIDAGENEHVVLGLVFRKYLADAFEERHAQLQKDRDADPEDPDEYRGDNIFWVPKEARRSHLQGNAKQPTVGKLVDDVVVAIGRDSVTLKGVLPQDHARPALDKHRLGELIDLMSSVGMGDKTNRSMDILGQVYEYFLPQFASAEGKKGGQFYTPRSVVRLLTEMLAPCKGRVFDPCCGSGGMFVQIEKFVEAHGGRIGDEGIDGKGILRMGGVLSFHVVFQCKRYKGSVSSAAVRDFRGAMVGRADKGLIITTGTFTRDARREAQRDGAPPIDLIDGELLAEKLRDLGLGVDVIQVPQVRVRAAWFEGLKDNPA